MSTIDDETIRVHLERRSGTLADSTRARLLGQVRHAIEDGALPLRSGPRLRLGVGRAAAGLIAAALTVLVLAVGAGLVSPNSTHLPGSSSSPNPSAVSSPADAATVQILSAMDLHTLLEANVLGPGRVVIADVPISALTPACALGSPCKTVYVIPGGDDSEVVVIENGLEYVRTSDGSVASRAVVVLRIGGFDAAWPANVVTILGRPAFDARVGQVWTVDGILGKDGLEDVEGLYPVDGWLSGWATSPSCPASVDPNGTIRDFGPYGCGSAAWLAPDQTRPVAGTFAGAPAGSIRVQNGAFQTFAPDPTTGLLDEAQLPQQAVYLIRMEALDGSWCFLCAGASVAQIVARLDPVPPSPEPSPSPSSPAVGAVAIRTIFDDPAWNGDPVPTDAVVLCIGASDCGSPNELYPGVDAPPSDVDFSSESMLRVVGGVPRSATWDGAVLEILIATRTGGFWEGAVGIDLGDVPEYRLEARYIVLIQ